MRLHSDFRESANQLGIPLDWVPANNLGGGYWKTRADGPNIAVQMLRRLDPATLRAIADHCHRTVSILIHTTGWQSGPGGTETYAGTNFTLSSAVEALDRLAALAETGAIDPQILPIPPRKGIAPLPVNVVPLRSGGA